MPVRKMERELEKVGKAIRPQCRSGPVKERGKEGFEKEASHCNAVVKGFNQTSRESSTQSSSSLTFLVYSLWLLLCGKI